MDPSPYLGFYVAFGGLCLMALLRRPLTEICCGGDTQEFMRMLGVAGMVSLMAAILSIPLIFSAPDHAWLPLTGVWGVITCLVLSCFVPKDPHLF